MSVRDKEPFSPDFRYDTIIKTISEIANGQLTFEWKPEGNSTAENDVIAKFKKDMENGVAIFTDRRSTTSQQEAVEADLFFAIMSLKINGNLKPSLGRDELVLGIASLNQRFIALTDLMKEILIVLSDVREVVQRLEKR